MAFMKYARGKLVHPSFEVGAWDKVRVGSLKGRVSDNLIEQASEIFQKPFDTKNYLLSHVSIVASVDTMEVPTKKVGSFVENGQKINRKYPNFRVTPETQPWINNNNDGWSREVLMSSYRTFIGAQNFQEHVQLEEHSKGRIIDAAARDIGPSVYIDILVATDRKHRELVSAIQNGTMSTLSMGCSIDFSQCTKCGHVAADETEMCGHIKYEKGNIFYDESGNRQKVAELCGHESHGDTAGVTFIEGSWVATPAFTGAVLRNILNPDNFNNETLKQAQMILSRPPEPWGDGFVNVKTGSHYSNDRVSGDFDFDEGGGDEEAPPKEKETSPFKEMEESVYKDVLDRVQKRLKKDINKDEIDNALTPENSTASPNDTLIKQASMYRSALHALIKTSNSDAEFINKLSQYNGEVGISIPVEIYRASLTLGSQDKHESLDQFLKSCRNVLGRRPSVSEQKTLIRLAKLLTLIKE